MIVPKESAWFGSFADNDGAKIVQFNETDLYKQDKLGFKELDESNKLKFLTIDAGHLQISEKFFIKEIVQKYFV